MPNMLRNVLAVVGGIVVGSAVNMALITLGPSLIAPPEGADVSTAEGLSRAMHLFEPRHFVMPFLAHALGTLAGALAAWLIAASHKSRFAWAIGVLFLCGGIAASVMIPAPTWFIALDLLAAYLPMAWLAVRIGRGMRQGTTAVPAHVLLAALSLHACGNSSAPATPPPARVPINTATGWSDSPFISGDGQRLYFMYSRYDFAPFILSGGTQTPVLRGPDRPGLHHSSQPFDESDIYVATKKADGSWGEPVNLGLNGAWGDASGMEIDGGRTFVWLQGNGTTNKIVMATRKADGTWGAAVDLGPEINDHSPGVFQDNPHISADGTALWFTSNRPTGSLGARDIWASSRSGGTWSAPVNLGTPFNTAGDEDQFWFSPGALDLYWNGPSGLMHCVSNGTTCSAAPTVVTIPGCIIAAEVSITDDGQLMYFACGDPSTGRVKIMYSRRQGGSWGTATPVD